MSAAASQVHPGDSSERYALNRAAEEHPLDVKTQTKEPQSLVDQVTAAFTTAVDSSFSEAYRNPFPLAVIVALLTVCVLIVIFSLMMTNCATHQTPIFGF